MYTAGGAGVGPRRESGSSGRVGLIHAGSIAALSAVPILPGDVFRVLAIASGVVGGCVVNVVSVAVGRVRNDGVEDWMWYVDCYIHIRRSRWCGSEG